MDDEISIHAPHAGSDKWQAAVKKAVEEFQSTLPMRGATMHKIHDKPFTRISIHAPHAGSDVVIKSRYALLDLFQSTLPMRGATGSCW